MKKSRIFAITMALLMALTVFTSFSAFATENATTFSAENGSDPSTTTTTTTPAIPAALSKTNIVKYSVNNPNVSFSLPGEFSCVTVESDDAAISAFGVSKSEFISYGYVAYAICDDSYSYCYITRSKDDYTSYVKDYKKLSSAEIESIVSAKASEYDSSTYALVYESVESVKLNGRTYVKGVSSNSTSATEVRVVEYSTIADGYEYVITCIYPKNMDQTSIDNFINAVESIKISGSIDIPTLISYIALAIGLISLAMSLILFAKSPAKQKEIGAYSYEEPQEDEAYYGVEEKTDTVEEYEAVDSEEQEAPEADEQSEEEISDQ